MKRIFTPLIFLVLILVACGDNTTDVGTAADDPIPAEADGGIGDGAEPLPQDAPSKDADAPIPVEGDGGIGDGAGPIPDELPSADPIDEDVITDYEPVDGKVTTPTEVVINPDNPSELWVRFVGGAAPCTAADVTVLTETPDSIEIELVVGITSDALLKSCLAGEFNLRVDVALNEHATGKNISWTQASSADDQPQLLTPDLSTDDFIGLTEAEASALAEENNIPWRVGRIDGESLIVTTDYSASRLNFELDDGVITAVTLG